MELSIVIAKWTKFPTFRSDFSFSDFALTKKNSNLAWSCWNCQYWSPQAQLHGRVMGCSLCYIRAVPLNTLKINFSFHPMAKQFPRELKEPLVVLLDSPTPFFFGNTLPPHRAGQEQFYISPNEQQMKSENPIDCPKASNSHPNSARVNMLIMTFALGSSASLSRLTFILFFILIYILNVKSSSGISYHFLNP